MLGMGGGEWIGLTAGRVLKHGAIAGVLAHLDAFQPDPAPTFLLDIAGHVPIDVLRHGFTAHPRPERSVEGPFPVAVGMASRTCTGERSRITAPQGWGQH